jgi:uncharacterized phage-associated protein
MARASAKNVADYIVAVAHDAGDPISNLKLQKLLYYSQGWHLALKDEPLFDERIEAWVHGPVVPPVYGQFKGYAWKPIEDAPESKDVPLPADVKQHLDDVMGAYLGFGAYDLERLTHSEPPWLNARAGIPEDAPCNSVISLDDMKAYFRSIADES